MALYRSGRPRSSTCRCFGRCRTSSPPPTVPCCPQRPTSLRRQVGWGWSVEWHLHFRLIHFRCLRPSEEAPSNREPTKLIIQTQEVRNSRVVAAESSNWMLSKLPRQRPIGANWKGAECGTEYQRAGKWRRAKEMSLTY